MGWPPEDPDMWAVEARFRGSKKEDDLPEEPKILHLSLRMQRIIGDPRKEKPGLGIAVYLIFGIKGQPSTGRAHGMAFLLSPEQYKELMESDKVIIHEHPDPIEPMKEGAVFPLGELMSKKNALDPREVQSIINDYLQALRLARGPQAADETELYYRKGWFYLRPSDYQGAMGIPYRPQEIKDKTAELRREIEPRPDSDSDGEPD